MKAHEALERLDAGNQRYVEDRVQGAGRDAAARRAVVAGQDPFAVILTCADSRVPPELIFDAGLGELFVVRVAGNLANTSSVASIEYAVAHLGTRLVVVLGHASCGAVAAALEGGDHGDNLRHLLGHLDPALDAAPDPEVNTVARHNAHLSARRMLEISEIIRHAAEIDDLQVVPAFYDLESGVVTFESAV